MPASRFADAAREAGPGTAHPVDGPDAASADTLLAALQFGDGQFPGGGFAFSWGLESLVADGAIRREGYADFLGGQLHHRWASLDRILVGHAHAAREDLPALEDLDDLTEALTTVEAARTGSQRAGRALLGTHARLGTNGAPGFKAAVDGGRAHGHLAVVQGVVLGGAGLDLQAALAVSAYTMASSLGTAAIRLGFIGHLDAQHALVRLRPGLARLLAQPLPGLDALCSFVPLADIAMMRHPDLAQRLFSN
jgi:urease accessory protein